MRAASVILFVGVLAFCSAQVGFWSNQTIAFDVMPAEKGDQAYPFTFTYEMIPINDQYYFELNIGFADFYDHYSIEFLSYPLAEVVVKDKGIIGITVLHTKDSGDQNGWALDALQCGLLSGVLHADAAPEYISSAMYLETFTTPDCYTEGTPFPEPSHRNYLPPIVAALISFFATIGAFLILIFCCCLCCRCLCRGRLSKYCSRKCRKSYPAESQETELQPAVEEYQPVPAEENIMPAAAPFPYVFPVFQTMVNGQPQYVMMYPQVQAPPTTV